MPATFEHGYALLIGVGQNAYAPWSLPVTVKDVQALHRVLTDPARSAYPTDTAHVRLLYDAGATGQAILDGLSWLGQQTAADPEATAIVFYSGHGWRDKEGSYWLIPHDVDPLDIPGSALAGVEFTAALRRITPHRLLVIMDCCHAAGMATAKAGQPAIKLPPDLLPTALPKGLVDELKQGAGRAVFSSSRGEELSWIRPDGTLSIYSHHLIEALEGKGSQATDTVVRLSSLMAHLSKSVPASAAAIGQVQTPFFETSSEDFPVALLAGGKGLHEKPSLNWVTGAVNTRPFVSEDIERMMERLGAEREHLGDLLLQRSKHGSAWAQPSIASGIREARKSIRRTKEALHDQGVTVPTHPDDEE